MTPPPMEDKALPCRAHTNPGSKLLFATILLLAVPTTIWWFFYFPYSVARLYGAVPAGAILLSEHDRPAERWRNLARNPILTNALDNAGISDTELSALLTNRTIDRAFHTLLKREAIFAYVPHLPSTGEPAWVGVSWVGAYGNLLRLALWCHTPKRLARTVLRSGHTVWTLRRTSASPTTGSCLSFAVSEGVLAACYSPDATGARDVVQRIGSGAPMPHELAERLKTDTPSYPPGATPDRIWFDWYRRGTDTPGYACTKVACGLESFTADRTAGWIRVAHDRPVRGPAKALDGNELRGVFGRTPCGIASLPFSHLMPWLREPGTNTITNALIELLRTCGDDDQTAVAALYGDAFGGRIMGLLIPAVAVGTRLKPDVDVFAAIAQAVDRVNARSRWALLVRQSQFKGHPVYLVDGTRDDLFSTLHGTSEQPAFTVLNGWLLFVSNLQTLQAILQDTAADSPGDPPPTWVRAHAAHPAPIFAWFDLDATARIMTHGIAVYALVLRCSDSARDRKTREKIESFLDWLVALRPLEQARMWGTTDANGSHLRVLMAPPQHETRPD